MNPENPNPTPPAGSPRPPITTQTYSAVPALAAAVAPRAATTLPPTSTYNAPPWTWAITRPSSPEHLVPLAALAVILASLVAIAGIFVSVAILVIKALAS
ncbi:MAG: hypothetical protein KF833_09995 [Verrucomicrobiae bacterium]|nr:hypothetical protein [Verrucomicrobiae bacterium]